MSLKRTALKRTREKPKPRLSFESASAAMYHVTRGSKGLILCACGCNRQATTWHHIFDQQHYEELADDPDNVVAVASYCHDRHTSAMARFPRSIAKRAEHLATTERMKAYLDRTYGPAGIVT